jgi:PAS domain-containing protein
MTSAQMCPDAALRRTEFYADWVRPQEDIIAGGGSVLLRDPTRLYVLGGNIRNRDGERLQPGWTGLLNDFVPLLQQALEMNRTLAGARLGNYLLRHQLDPDTAAVLILTAEGRPVSVDPRAATLLEAGEVLRLTPSGTAAFTDPHAESRLTALRRQAGRVAPHSFGLRAPDGAEWRCSLAVLSAEEDLARLLGSAFFVPPPLIVLALTRPQVQRPPPQPAWRRPVADPGRVRGRADAGRGPQPGRDRRPARHPAGDRAQSDQTGDVEGRLPPSGGSGAPGSDADGARNRPRFGSPAPPAIAVETSPDAPSNGPPGSLVRRTHVKKIRPGSHQGSFRSHAHSYQASPPKGATNTPVLIVQKQQRDIPTTKTRLHDPDGSGPAL